MKKIEYFGTLILEGGLRLHFHEEFKHSDDIPDWIMMIENGELFTEIYTLIWIKEDGTEKVFYIPTDRILAYSLN